MELSSTISERVKRVRAGATQKTFAERLGVDVRTIKRWETGTLIPNGSSLLNFIQCYGVDTNWLLTGTGTPPDASISVTELQILNVLREKGQEATRTVLELLELARYRIERQGHESEWKFFSSADNFDEALVQAKIGFRRVIDLYTGQIVFSGTQSGLS